ncbi:thiamine-phosphate kinase [Acetobacter indonesiensis]|uniref:thiamine-phosphate kinase n=1 Tax=Acetobacter indonesiensis TaxID=104101 RepID=UPI001F013283|nr:thiamine-phosphate kinase [Acetobacter indonesiensis]MCG0995790.1 thiamine-phosphate kinase [Acetobacter indonesiensis]
MEHRWKRATQLTDLPAEFKFIHHYFSELAGPGSLALTDDAAVFMPPAGRELVVAADAMVENVHFLPNDPPETIGRKLLRCNLSDLAAMGARPEGWLLTLARPQNLEDEWFEGFCKGLKEDQKLFSLSLLGGDTTSTKGPLVLSLTIIGSVLPGQAIKRTGAQAGDGLWVTGTIGDGALGLRALQGHLSDPSGYLSARYRLPQPRVGAPLYGLASAAMDISDGLLQDAEHLARQNDLGVEIFSAEVPLSAAARHCGPQWLETCLTGGDDYELLFSVPPEHEADLEHTGSLRTVLGEVPVTRVGRFHSDYKGVRVLETGGSALTFQKKGWSHI